VSFDNGELNILLLPNDIVRCITLYVLMNAPCAEAGRNDLNDFGVSTPSGIGPVKGMETDQSTATGCFVNPYQYYFNFSVIILHQNSNISWN